MQGVSEREEHDGNMGHCSNHHSDSVTENAKQAQLLEANCLRCKLRRKEGRKEGSKLEGRNKGRVGKKRKERSREERKGKGGKKGKRREGKGKEKRRRKKRVQSVLDVFIPVQCRGRL